MVVTIDANTITNEVGNIQDVLAVEKSAKVIALNSNKAQEVEYAIAA